MGYIEHPTTKDRLLYWTPRIASLLFVGFISLFALYVFCEYRGWELVLALFMHLLPSFVLLVAIALAWKYDILGVIIFFGFAVLYVIWAGLDRPWTWYAFVSGPSALIGILYFVSWVRNKEQKKQ